MKKFGWKGVLGVAISALSLYFAFRGLHWVDALERARHANYGLLILATVVATTTFPLRARRWRTILDPVVPQVPFGPLWRATTIGMMITNVVFGRAGEFVRPYALSQEIPSITYSMAFASVVVDRVFDAVVVLLLLAVAMLAPGFPSGATILSRPVSEYARAFAIVPLAALIGSYALVFFPTTLIKLFESVARRIHPALEAKGREMLQRFAEGLGVLRNPRHFVAVFLWTLLHWLVQPLAFWIALRAFGIHVPWAATLFLQGVIVILVAVPSTPGFVGIFEAGTIAALAVFGVGQTSALTWAVVFHLFTFVPITVIGAYYFARAGFKMGDINSAQQRAIA